MDAANYVRDILGRRGRPQNDEQPRRRRQRRAPEGDGDANDAPQLWQNLAAARGRRERGIQQQAAGEAFEQPDIDALFADGSEAGEVGSDDEAWAQNAAAEDRHGREEHADVEAALQRPLGQSVVVAPLAFDAPKQGGRRWEEQVLRDANAMEADADADADDAASPPDLFDEPPATPSSELVRSPRVSEAESFDGLPDDFAERVDDTVRRADDIMRHAGAGSDSGSAFGEAVPDFDSMLGDRQGQEQALVRQEDTPQQYRIRHYQRCWLCQHGVGRNGAVTADVARTMFACVQQNVGQPIQATARQLFVLWAQLVRGPAMKRKEKFIDMTELDFIIHLTEYMNSLPEMRIKTMLDELDYMRRCTVAQFNYVAKPDPNDLDAPPPDPNALPKVRESMGKLYCALTDRTLRVMSADTRRMFGHVPEMDGANFANTMVMPHVRQRVSHAGQLEAEDQQRRLLSGPVSYRKPRRQRPSTSAGGGSHRPGEFVW